MRYDAKTLYAVTDNRINKTFVHPGAGLQKRLAGCGMTVLTVRIAMQQEAEALWQNPLHSGWTVAPDPKYYLSTSEGKWRVVFQGSPICPDTDEEGARRAAKFVGIDLSHGMIWDGDRGVWTRHA